MIEKKEKLSTTSTNMNPVIHITKEEYDKYFTKNSSIKPQIIYSSKDNGYIGVLPLKGLRKRFEDGLYILVGIESVYDNVKYMDKKEAKEYKDIEYYGVWHKLTNQNPKELKPISELSEKFLYRL